MSKGTGPQTNKLFQNTAKAPAKKKAAITPDTSETSGTAGSIPAPEKLKKDGKTPSKQGQGGGRPRLWADGEKQKFTTVMLPRHMDVLREHAARATLEHGIDTDRSGVLRALIGKLERGETVLKASDFQ